MSTRPSSTISYHCRRPDELTLAILPKQGGPYGPLGRCGHTILTVPQRLAILRERAIFEVVDTVTVQEHRRNEHGGRLPGWFGARFGFSPHRCDNCKRERELKSSIVCPCCRKLIMLGDEVMLISTEQVIALSPFSYMIPFSASTADGTFSVVCGACGTIAFGDQEELGMWRKNRVELRRTTLEDVS